MTKLDDLIARAKLLKPGESTAVGGSPTLARLAIQYLRAIGMKFVTRDYTSILVRKS